MVDQNPKKKRAFEDEDYKPKKYKKKTRKVKQADEQAKEEKKKENAEIKAELHDIAQEINDQKAGKLNTFFVDKLAKFTERFEKEKDNVETEECETLVTIDQTSIKWVVAVHKTRAETVEYKVLGKRISEPISLPPLSTWASTQRNFLEETPAKFYHYINDNYYFNEFKEEFSELHAKLKEERNIDFTCVIDLFTILLDFQNYPDRDNYPHLGARLAKLKSLPRKAQVVDMCTLVSDFFGFFTDNQLMLRLFEHKLDNDLFLPVNQAVEESAIPSIDKNNEIQFSLETDFQSSYQNLLCTGCAFYDCYSHNSSTCFDSLSNVVRKEDQKAKSEPCKNDCYIGQENELKQKPYKCNWIVQDLNFFLALTKMFPANFCRISAIMNKKCSEVFQHSLNRKDGDLLPTHVNQNLNKKSKRNKTNDGNNSLARPKGSFCRCKGHCNSGVCPCFISNRECNPEMCTTCGSANDESATTCKNNPLQRGKRKRLLLGASDIAGWGIFINEPAEKDEVISEYCGETIPQNEGDKRGELYDNTTCSFLFNLNYNSDVLIDAKRKGNKIRFANHSKNANCSAKIVKVDGIQRIQIFANTSLKRYEELFFDYKYGHNEKTKFTNVDLNFELPKKQNADIEAYVSNKIVWTGNSPDAQIL